MKGDFPFPALSNAGGRIGSVYGVDGEAIRRRAEEIRTEDWHHPKK